MASTVRLAAFGIVVWDVGLEAYRLAFQDGGFAAAVVTNTPGDVSLTFAPGNFAPVVPALIHIAATREQRPGEATVFGGHLVEVAGDPTGELRVTTLTENPAGGPMVLTPTSFRVDVWIVEGPTLQHP